jgi:translocation and assembly module TamA
MLVSFLAHSQGITLRLLQNGETSYQNAGDSLQATQLILTKLVSLRNEGFLAASVDTLVMNGDTLTAYLESGGIYNYIAVGTHNLGSEFLAEQTAILPLRSFSSLQKKVLNFYEQNGYPFVKIYLQSNVIAGDTLQCDILLDIYSKFVYDTLAYIGNSSISKRYLSKYLDIEAGNVYNETVITAIGKKLRNLPLIRLNAPVHISFYQGIARVVLNIDDVVTDRLDGIVGLAPNSANGKADKLLLTGEVNIELNNILKSGKQMELHWRNYLQNSQKLDLSLTYPYLFNTKLGINGEFGINKFDTVFVNLASKLSFRYQQKGNNYLQFYYQNISSNLITADTNAVRLQKKIPNNNPYKIDNYGLAVFQRDYNYLPNPTKGYSILADLAIGRKTLLKNTEISQVKYINTENDNLISVYDTLKTKSLRFNVKITGSLFIPIKSRSTILQKWQVNALFADKVLFNELYNFGGFSTLRGFDENGLFASKALLYTIEYRYLIGENSNVGIFANAAAIENNLVDAPVSRDLPYGFGVLANLQVGKGILNLAYALGSQNGNPILLNTGKFHFGIVNYF